MISCSRRTSEARRERVRLRVGRDSGLNGESVRFVIRITRLFLLIPRHRYAYSMQLGNVNYLLRSLATLVLNSE